MFVDIDVGVRETDGSCGSDLGCGSFHPIPHSILLNDAYPL